MNTLVLSTGSNLGNRKENLDSARRMIGEYIGRILNSSAIYESRSWGYRSENLFYNQCLSVETELGARDCLDQVHKVERLLGRARETTAKGINSMEHVPKEIDWEANVYLDRIIDIDILFYNDLILDTGSLKIPHERLAERRFVLLPLAEILPCFQHPVLHKNIRELLKKCPDPLVVYPVKES